MLRNEPFQKTLRSGQQRDGAKDNRELQEQLCARIVVSFAAQSRRIVLELLRHDTRIISFFALFIALGTKFHRDSGAVRHAQLGDFGIDVVQTGIDVVRMAIGPPVGNLGFHDHLIGAGVAHEHGDKSRENGEHGDGEPDGLVPRGLCVRRLFVNLVSVHGHKRFSGSARCQFIHSIREKRKRDNSRSSVVRDNLGGRLAGPSRKQQFSSTCFGRCPGAVAQDQSAIYRRSVQI